jgi:hypothetical protein
MTTHTPELVMALSCLSGLLALLACVIWQYWRASRNERTDRLMRRGMAAAYRRGMLAGHVINPGNPRSEYPTTRGEL